MVASKVMDSIETFGEKTAIIYKDEKITYKELENKIKLAKDFIKQIDLEEHEPIGICINNSPEFLTILLACELENHAAVLLSPGFKETEFLYHIKNGGVRYVISYANHDLLNAFGAKKTVQIDGLAIYFFSSIRCNNIYLSGDFICQLTSGTNGKAKGAIRTSESVELEIEETIPVMKVTEEDCFLTIPPLCHSFGLIAGALLPLSIGCTLVLLPVFTAGNVVKAMKERTITVLFAVPFMYKILADSHYHEKDYFRSLKKCISAGAPLKEEVFWKFYELTGAYIMQDYGSTETGVMAFNDNPIGQISSVGKVVGSRKFQIIDRIKEDGTVDRAGRLLTKSKCDLRRYCYPDSANKNILDGWLGLGDIGYMDSSENLYVQGRECNMINCGGLKVDPKEIEAVIQEIPEVLETVVVGKEVSPYGEVVKAIVVKNGNITKTEIVKHCQGKLGAHKVPKVITFVEEIPRSATGKIQRKYLTN